MNIILSMVSSTIDFLLLHRLKEQKSKYLRVTKQNLLLWQRVLRKQKGGGGEFEAH